jgi:hypothetical protein
MTRTDIHRPSVIDPEDYEFVAMECVPSAFDGDIEACYAQQEARQRIRAHMAHTGGAYSHHQHGGNCMVCGCANMIYSCLFYHEKTNTYIRTGQDCAEKMDMGDPAAFNIFRSAVLDWREAKAGQRKAVAVLTEKGLIRAWEIRSDYEKHWDDRKPLVDVIDDLYKAGRLDTPEHIQALRDLREYDLRWQAASTIYDIVGKLIKYGSISDKAMDFLRTLIDRHDRAPQIAAEREAERAGAANCPTGRTVVTGTVLKVEEHESSFGVTLKMTVKAKEGFIVWVSVPAGMSVERGSEVRFKATLTPSDRDPKFGFGKVPKAVTA